MRFLLTFNFSLPSTLILQTTYPPIHSSGVFYYRSCWHFASSGSYSTNLSLLLSCSPCPTLHQNQNSSRRTKVGAPVPSKYDLRDQVLALERKSLSRLHVLTFSSLDPQSRACLDPREFIPFSKGTRIQESSCHLISARTCYPIQSTSEKRVAPPLH